MKSNSINIVLQGKGGVGKSFLSSILAQYFLDFKKIKMSGADTDPVNQSFASIKRIGAAQIEILRDGAIIQSKFDAIFEKIIAEQKTTFVIDNGASTFVPMMKYINDNDIVSIFDSLNRPVYIHTVIVGGQSQTDTLQGLMSLYELITESSNVKLVIWLNEFQGSIEIPAGYSELVSDKTAAIITIHNRNSDAFNDDLEKLTKARMTNEEAQKSNEFGLMSKNRLNKVFTEVYLQLDDLFDPQSE
ncbi:conjugal transfer protein TraL [Gilliamella sp. W8126]|uniref:conjugal transfer protein TraL n=1 Tax=Gilliamella sp. W8126 TaxID=2750946 RepID=UPI0018DC5F4A|nr:conjugal transfer protein TraL [Gilliamella sp. W8126]MBI0006981.1 conjugal transfer protein TraL [Gilliamella sp. W8126]